VLRPTLTLLTTLALVAATAAAGSATLARTPGGVQLTLQNGHGFAKLVARGAFLGRVKGHGKVWATENVSVNHYGSKKEVNEGVFRYRGRGMSIFVESGSSWRVRVRGAHVYGGGPSIRGCLWLNGVDSGKTGTYQIGTNRTRAWPRKRTGPLRVGSVTC
jgi:hypothetical protein